MALARTTTHTTAADGTFSASGAAAWNLAAAHTNAITGAVSGGIPYFSSTTSEASSGILTAGRVVLGGGAGAAPNDSANLTFGSALLAINASSGNGWKIGDTANSTYAGIWGSAIASPTIANYTIAARTDGSELNLRSTGALYIIAGSAIKASFTGTAGAGVDVTAGIGTTDVQALSATQTWNAAGVTFTALKAVITNTASAAGSLLIDLQTAGGGTQFSVGATGLITTGGTAGAASFGPGLPTSITVKNGIITAIS